LRTTSCRRQRYSAIADSSSVSSSATIAGVIRLRHGIGRAHALPELDRSHEYTDRDIRDRSTDHGDATLAVQTRTDDHTGAAGSNVDCPPEQAQQRQQRVTGFATRLFGERDRIHLQKPYLFMRLLRS
jgi:hypothetical protein